MCDLCTPRPYGKEDRYSNSVEAAAAYERNMSADDRDEVSLSDWE